MAPGTVTEKNKPANRDASEHRSTLFCQGEPFRLKKCPGCGSIGSDEESTCGVCGEDLSNVSPMTQTIDQSELEEESKSRVEERLLIRQMQKKGVLKALSGTVAGFAILIPGLVFFSLWGILLILTGLIVIVTAIFGPLGYGGSFLWRKGRGLMREEEARKRIEREQAPAEPD